MSWNIQQLADDVGAAYGHHQQALLEPCLQSIDERRAFARYHHHECVRLLTLAPTEHTDAEILDWMWGQSATAEQSFGWVRFHAAAHINACVHNLHSVCDILAHAVYFATAMNLSPETSIKLRDLSVRSVRRKVLSPTLRSDLTELSDNAGFAYLAALSNHSKHRSIVPIPFHLDLSGEDELPHGLKFGAFDYEGVSYAERWVSPTLKVEYQRQEALIHSIGNELNSLAASRRT